MIRMPTLDQARAKAEDWARQGVSVHIYALNRPGGGYWISQTPPDRVSGWTGDLEYLETRQALKIAVPRAC